MDVRVYRSKRAVQIKRRFATRFDAPLNQAAIAYPRLPSAVRIRSRARAGRRGRRDTDANSARACRRYGTDTRRAVHLVRERAYA